MKRQRICDNPDISTLPHGAQATVTSLYHSQATQTLDPAGCIDCRKRKGINDEYLSPKPKYLRLSSFARAGSRVTDWAESLPDEFEDMSNRSSSKRRRSSADELPPTDSMVSDFSLLRNRLDQYGIMLQDTNRLSSERQADCKKFLDGELVPGACLIYPQEELTWIIDDTAFRLEAYVQRDILPWTVPSIENLSRTKEWENSSIKEQMHSVWNIPNTMGHTQPKPDYVAGHSEKSLTSEEMEEYNKLYALHKGAKPLQINTGFLLPFLICEAKSGVMGLATAQAQNCHAGGIVVRAMYRLYQEAYLDPETAPSLDEQILVWSIDMNHETVHIYGHYGKLGDGNLANLKIYRQRIAQVQLHNEAQRFVPYNFVRNIYDTFAPKHLNRMKDALKQMRTNHSTGLSFNTSTIAIQPTDPPVNENRPDSLVESAMLRQQLAAMMQLMQTMQENMVSFEGIDTSYAKSKQQATGKKHESKLEAAEKKHEAQIEAAEKKHEAQIEKLERLLREKQNAKIGN